LEWAYKILLAAHGEDGLDVLRVLIAPLISCEAVCRADTARHSHAMLQYGAEVAGVGLKRMIVNEVMTCQWEDKEVSDCLERQPG
jgi:hypothetical protein